MEGTLATSNHGPPPAKKYRGPAAKTFQCRGFGECRMVFSRSEHLARHVRKHTGERPFKCHCGKQFSRLDNLRQHAHTVHADRAEQNEQMMRDLGQIHSALAMVGSGRDDQVSPMNEKGSLSAGGMVGIDYNDNSPTRGFPRVTPRNPHARPDTSAGYEVNYSAEHGGDYFQSATLASAQHNPWSASARGADQSFRANTGFSSGAPSFNAAGASPASTGGQFPRSGHSFRFPNQSLSSQLYESRVPASPLGLQQQQHHGFQQSAYDHQQPQRSGGYGHGPAGFGNQHGEHHVQSFGPQSAHPSAPSTAPLSAGTGTGSGGPPGSASGRPGSRETLPPVSILLDRAPPPSSRPGTGVRPGTSGFGASYPGSVQDQPGGAVPFYDAFGSPPGTGASLGGDGFSPPFVSDPTRPTTAPAEFARRRHFPLPTPTAAPEATTRRLPPPDALAGAGALPATAGAFGYAAAAQAARASPPGFHAQLGFGGGRPGTASGAGGQYDSFGEPPGRAGDAGLLFGTARQRSPFGPRPPALAQPFQPVDQHFFGVGSAGGRIIEQPPSPGYESQFAFQPPPAPGTAGGEPGAGGGGAGVYSRPNTAGGYLSASRPGTATAPGGSSSIFAYRPPPTAPNGQQQRKRSYPFAADDDGDIVLSDAAAADEPHTPSSASRPISKLPRPFTATAGAVGYAGSRRGSYDVGGGAAGQPRPYTGISVPSPNAARQYGAYDGLYASPTSAIRGTIRTSFSIPQSPTAAPRGPPAASASPTHPSGLRAVTHVGAGYANGHGPKLEHVAANGYGHADAAEHGHERQYAAHELRDGYGGSGHVPSPDDASRPPSRRLSLMDICESDSPTRGSTGTLYAASAAGQPAVHGSDSSGSSNGSTDTLTGPSRSFVDGDATAAGDGGVRDAERPVPGPNGPAPAGSAADGGPSSAPASGSSGTACTVPPARRVSAISHLLATPTSSPQLTSAPAPSANAGPRNWLPPNPHALGVNGYPRGSRSQSASPSLPRPASPWDRSGAGPGGPAAAVPPGLPKSAAPVAQAAVTTATTSAFGLKA